MGSIVEYTVKTIVNQRAGGICEYCYFGRGGDDTRCPAGSIAANVKSDASKPSKRNQVPAWYFGEKRRTKQDDFISIHFFGAFARRFGGLDQTTKNISSDPGSRIGGPDRA